ncbi:hypothetical protein KSF_061010 [Reticulibacter mediterranei]|uniref:Transposase IS4-like domain-containing protein n=1 Tax=Reticulibacter mediterranei TaxID=2778369 RepID=A0A8J3N524_9CHLR|nr:hypothetical protein KSF_061010 [Reticulibacter mediterranei]
MHQPPIAPALLALATIVQTYTGVSDDEVIEDEILVQYLAPETSLERLITLAHARWASVQFYEDAKQECGLDHYQGRSWNGLHRHLALALLAYSFLMLHRLTLPLPPEEAFSPCITRSSLPGVHRQVLLWLFQDLVLWLLQTEQVQTFRPRRN